MNFFQRNIMPRGFGFAELTENGGGVLSHAIGELRFIENFQNSRKAAVFSLVFSCNADKRGGHAVFPDFFGGDGPAWNLQALQAGAQECQVTTGVYDGAERHVAADTAKTVKIRKFHEFRPMD